MNFGEKYQEKTPKKEVTEYFTKHPNPTDEEFHDFSESRGVDPDKMEEAAYALLSDLLAEGKHMENPDAEMPPKQLSMGRKVEMEHTDNPDIAKRIAQDHITEFPDYYSRLEDMEQKAKEDHSMRKTAEEALDNFSRVQRGELPPGAGGGPGAGMFLGAGRGQGPGRGPGLGTQSGLGMERMQDENGELPPGAGGGPGAGMFLGAGRGLGPGRGPGLGTRSGLGLENVQDPVYRQLLAQRIAAIYNQPTYESSYSRRGAAIPQLLGLGMLPFFPAAGLATGLLGGALGGAYGGSLGRERDMHRRQAQLAQLGVYG